MRRLIGYCIVALLVLPASLYAQASVVDAKKRELGFTRNLSPEQIHTLLTAVAKEVHGGLFVKTTGNNCLGHSCDIICFTGQSTMFDVLGSSETDATPQWLSTPFPSGGVCDMVPTDTTDPGTPPDTSDIAEIRKSIEALAERVARLETTSPPSNSTAEEQLATTKAILELLRTVAARFGVK